MAGSEVAAMGSYKGVPAADVVGRGETTLITGCMFSGKTTLLLRALADQDPRASLAFRHTIDDRYRTDAIVAHDGRCFPAHTIGHARDLHQWVIDARIRLIAIDEVHFLDEALMAALERIVMTGVSVMMAGLDVDSWGHPFPHMVRLARFATHSVHCTAVCAQCGGVANRTQRRVPIVNGRLIGGPESYEARCTACWTPPPYA